MINWEAIAAVAEILGAIGVIASLAYLAGQVRTAGNQARQTALQSVMNQMNIVWTQIAAERGVAENFAKGSQGLANLEDETARLRFSAFLLSVFRPYEEIFHYRKNGMVDDWTWESISGQCHALMGTPGFAEWWSLREDWFSRAFRNHITETLATIPEYRRWTNENLRAAGPPAA
jgi:hypothetical protein